MTVRCKVCRTRRATFTSLLRHVKESGHRKPCQCSGYHYPHRPGSPCCDQDPRAPYMRAVRAGEMDMADALIEMAFDGIGGKISKPGDPCPF